MLLLVCGGGRDGPQPGRQHQSLHTEARVKGRGGDRDRVAAKDSREARDTADGTPGEDGGLAGSSRERRGKKKKRREKEHIMVWSEVKDKLYGKAEKRESVRIWV